MVVDYIVNFDLQLTLIVCPKSVLNVWPAEFAKHAAKEIAVTSLSYGTVGQRATYADQRIKLAKARRSPLVIVVNYEAFRYAAMQTVAMKTQWDMMVCDESQRIKNATGKDSQIIARIGKLAERRVCLTGTPMPHSQLDIFGQYRFLDSSIFGRWYTTFRSRYAIMGGYKPANARQGVEVVGWRKQDELNRKFYSIAQRVTKREVLDLPRVIHETRPVELGKDGQRAYRDLEREFVTQVEEGIVTVGNALTKLLRLQQLTSGFLKIDLEETGGREVITEIDTGKAELLREIFDDLPPGEPVVVFCMFRPDLQKVRDVADDAGRCAFELSGQANQLIDWQTSHKGDVLAVQIKAGGVGIDLTRSAYAIYYSVGFSLGNYEQSLARLDRPGQTRSVTYLHLVAGGTIDERVYAALAARKNAIEAILVELSMSSFEEVKT